MLFYVLIHSRAEQESSAYFGPSFGDASFSFSIHLGFGDDRVDGINLLTNEDKKTSDVHISFCLCRE